MSPRGQRDKNVPTSKVMSGTHTYTQNILGGLEGKIKKSLFFILVKKRGRKTKMCALCCHLCFIIPSYVCVCVLFLSYYWSDIGLSASWPLWVRWLLGMVGLIWKMHVWKWKAVAVWRALSTEQNVSPPVTFQWWIFRIHLSENVKASQVFQPRVISSHHLTSACIAKKRLSNIVILFPYQALKYMYVVQVSAKKG